MCSYLVPESPKYQPALTTPSGSPKRLGSLNKFTQLPFLLYFQAVQSARAWIHFLWSDPSSTFGNWPPLPWSRCAFRLV